MNWFITRNPITGMQTHATAIAVINFHYRHFPIKKSYNSSFFSTNVHRLLFLFIGAVFHDENHESEIAFRYAIKRINMYETGFELEPLVRYVSSYDSFKTERIGNWWIFIVAMENKRRLLHVLLLFELFYRSFCGSAENGNYELIFKPLKNFFNIKFLKLK